MKQETRQRKEVGHKKGNQTLAACGFRDKSKTIFTKYLEADKRQLNNFQNEFCISKSDFLKGAKDRIPLSYISENKNKLL